ncbi:aspartyl protease family protein [Caulobacter hibisci]|uniref:Aspartyl protease family protein n=1 Tax=Caulobacter hibisci TaxID=2035993 RepID=A0ABS0SRL5_9CAUL|nr:aspartyl protease family protein [Caulobacter hibisci]MBI1682250.1 aspartyl protease family protein [Caulobacter hibisci]
MFNRRRVLSLLSSPFLASVAGRALAADGVVAAPITLNDKRILIDVTLGGKGPYPFAIDTGGAFSLIRESLAEELKLRQVRTLWLNGKPSPIYEAKDVVMGGAVRQQIVAFGGIEGLRLGAQGALAAGLLTTGDSELDLDAGEWRLFPNGPPDRNGYVRAPAELRLEGANASKRIFGQVMLNGAPLEAILDTGGPLVLTMPYEEGVKRGLWNDATPYSPQSFSGGVLGLSKSRGRMVRAKRLELGPIVQENVLVCVRPPDMDQAGQRAHAVLGLPFLRTMNWSLSSDALWVRRNSQAPTVPTYALSGVWVTNDGGKVVVDSVGGGSPAAKAGVRPGDVVQNVADLREAIALFNGPAGQPSTVTLKRGGETVTAEFVMTDYL